MADSPDELDSAGDPNDDGQLTIRIPNPKVYMARQSLWIGRRGKPRCDHCRLNNLKCDRVLPACNHCSWASGRDCKYTPLPTPAHRGIPRCDRCRLNNFKCDRNLPVCNHCADDPEAECNYTPKKRHKTETAAASDPHESQDIQPASPLLAGAPLKGTNEDSPPGGHTFYGQNVASTSRGHEQTTTPLTHDRDDSSERDPVPYPQSGRFNYHSRVLPRKSPLPPIAPKPPLPTNQLSFISHSFPPDQGMVTSSSFIEPWSHPSFVPLPGTVLRRLATINSIEMPNRAIFEESLSAFVANLMIDLRETAALSPHVYSTVARSLTTKDTSIISGRLASWTNYHHACSGSSKYSLILLPRDDVFELGRAEEEKLRKVYASWVDASMNPEDKFRFLEKADGQDLEEGTHEWAKAFERLPVQPQIYDMLAYAHSAHGSSYSMISGIKELGVAGITWPMAELFIRICPLCALRSKQGIKVDPNVASTFDSI